MAENELHVQESITSPEVDRAKPLPKPTAIAVPFFYAPSDDGADENLLILLHGLGICGWLPYGHFMKAI